MIADAEALALYFGCLDEVGHYLFSPPNTKIWDPPPACPWTLSLMDSGLLNNRKVPDVPDGRVHWMCGGRTVFWFAFVWWDRSVDSRGACNSGFYVRGFTPPVITRASVEEASKPAFTFACEQWPEVVSRQRYPLVLQELPLP